MALRQHSAAVALRQGCAVSGAKGYVRYASPWGPGARWCAAYARGFNCVPVTFRRPSTQLPLVVYSAQITRCASHPLYPRSSHCVCYSLGPMLYTLPTLPTCLVLFTLSVWTIDIHAA